MNKEIEKLAMECFPDMAVATTHTIMVTRDELEAFYKAAYSRGHYDGLGDFGTLEYERANHQRIGYNRAIDDAANILFDTYKDGYVRVLELKK